MSMSTPELQEAIDGGLGLAVRLREALADKRVSLDELVNSVTDGNVRQSLVDLYNSVTALTHGASPDWPRLVTLAAHAAIDVTTALSTAIKSDGFQISDLLAGVTDASIREDLRTAAEGAEAIPDEIENISTMELFDLFRQVSSWIPRLVPHR